MEEDTDNDKKLAVNQSCFSLKVRNSPENAKDGHFNVSKLTSDNPVIFIRL